MKLSIIIVTYNSLDYIQECIDSILSNIDIIEYEIIVVDNSPKGASLKMELFLKELYGEKVKFVHNSKNLGYGQGNNIGIKQSNGDILCIMNPDIIITEKKLFKDSLSQFNCNPRLGMLGYKQLGGHNLSFYFRQEYYLPFISAITTKLLNKINLFNSKFMFLSGAFFFTKRDIFAKIGNFDESFFLYNEESDITKRLLMNNYSVKYVREISYIHNIGERNESSFESFRISIDSSIHYLTKYQYNIIFFLRKTKFELKVKSYLSRLTNNKYKANNCNNKIKYITELIS